MAALVEGAMLATMVVAADLAILAAVEEAATTMDQTAGMGVQAS